MISVKEAIEKILATIDPLGLERINILDSLGRIIGEDIIAKRDIPPTDNSAMDGYALRAEDTWGASAQNPITLEIVEDIPAGAVPQKKIGLGQAARIMTGAPIPEGANAVLRVEDTVRENNKVKVLVAVPLGQDIRKAGEDVTKGAVIIPRGTKIRPAHVGMLASLGHSFVYVHQRPTVAIMATGDELVEIDEVPSPWQIINSNSYSIFAQVKECGAIPMQLGIARDRREDLKEKFMAALRADVIITTGGVSVGDYDLVKDIMAEMGSTIHFWQVAMRPGKPLVYGTIGKTPVFGLPGNPVSAMVSFEQFVRPALLKMMGAKKIFRRVIRAILEEDVKKKKELVHFIRANISIKDGQYFVTTTGEQGSGILRSMVKANGLIVAAEKKDTLTSGSIVTVQLLDDTLEMEEKISYL